MHIYTNICINHHPQPASLFLMRGKILLLFKYVPRKDPAGACPCRPQKGIGWKGAHTECVRDEVMKHMQYKGTSKNSIQNKVLPNLGIE